MWQKKKGVKLIHSHWVAIVLAVVFLLDSLREKRSVPLAAHQVNIAAVMYIHYFIQSNIKKSKPAQILLSRDHE